MNRTRMRTIVIVGLMAGLLLLLGITGIGIIRIPPANFTIMQIPVIIGTIILGLKSGLVLSLVFGLWSVYTAFTGGSPLVLAMLSAPVSDDISALPTILVISMSIIARLMIPIVVNIICKAMAKKERLSVCVAAAAGSITNTIFYLGMMLIFYAILKVDNSAVLALIGGVAALNGSLEAVASVIITVPVVLALKKKVGGKE